MKFHNASDKQHHDLHNAYIAGQQATGQKCPHCGTVILVKVKHPKTGQMVCPACGK
jgi:uncharacterized Zn finger protein (UPF0148 family)